MSSIEIASAVLMGTEPERRVSCEWHKGGTYTVSIIEQQPDTPVWRVIDSWHHSIPCRGGVRMAALRRFTKLVDDHWSPPD